MAIPIWQVQQPNAHTPQIPVVLALKPMKLQKGSVVFLDQKCSLAPKAMKLPEVSVVLIQGSMKSLKLQFQYPGLREPWGSNGESSIASLETTTALNYHDRTPKPLWRAMKEGVQKLGGRITYLRTCPEAFLDPFEKSFYRAQSWLFVSKKAKQRRRSEVEHIPDKGGSTTPVWEGYSSPIPSSNYVKDTARTSFCIWRSVSREMEKGWSGPGSANLRIQSRHKLI